MTVTPETGAHVSPDTYYFLHKLNQSNVDRVRHDRTHGTQSLCRGGFWHLMATKKGACQNLSQ